VERVRSLVPGVIEFDDEVLFQQQSLPGQHRLSDVSPSSPVVVQFTSGSTGRPKGIVIQHNSLCSSAAAHAAFYKIGPPTRMYNFAAFVFDVSVADMWTT
jgi:long-subunit acyl-CoA synthetase (AMP-forming)